MLRDSVRLARVNVLLVDALGGTPAVPARLDVAIRR